MKKVTDKKIAISDDQRKGYGDSLYKCDTGRQSRNDAASIKRIVLQILKITSGLSSLMLYSRN
jgi:hypothetical protein